MKSGIPYRIFANVYDKLPEYIVYAGLVIQPVTKNLIAAHQIKNADVLYLYRHYVEDSVFIDHPQMVVLTKVLSHPVNSEFRIYQHQLIEEINGMKIKRLIDVAKALSQKVEQHKITLYGSSRPILLNAEKAMKASIEIAQRYQIPRPYYLGEKK